MTRLYQGRGIFAFSAEKRAEYRFRPHTGRFWLDLIYLTLLMGVEEVLLRPLSSSYFLIDLVTPWLLVSFVQKQKGAALFLAIYAGFMQEARSSLPQGTFLCAYLVMVTVLLQVRSALSWRYATPWLVGFALSELLIASLITTVILVLGGGRLLGSEHFVDLALRVGAGVGFGYLLCRPWLAFDAEEPVPP